MIYSPAPQFYCSNHPGVPTPQVCADCGRPFCESCLTEMVGQVLCGWCRDQRLQRIQQRASVNPSTIVLLARVFNGVALLLTLAFAALYAGIFAFTGMMSPGTNISSSDQLGINVVIGITLVAAVLALVMYLPPLFWLARGRSWLWTWELVALVLTALGGCVTLGSIGMMLLAPAVGLLICWIKPEVRDYCSLDS